MNEKWEVHNESLSLSIVVECVGCFGCLLMGLS